MRKILAILSVKLRTAIIISVAAFMGALSMNGHAAIILNEVSFFYEPVTVHSDVIYYPGWTAGLTIRFDDSSFEPGVYDFQHGDSRIIEVCPLRDETVLSCSAPRWVSDYDERTIARFSMNVNIDANSRVTATDFSTNLDAYEYIIYDLNRYEAYAEGGPFRAPYVNQVWSVSVPPVPIPAAAWLFGSAILGLGALKHKTISRSALSC